jgi:small subunit ribosomal protein S5
MVEKEQKEKEQKESQEFVDEVVLIRRVTKVTKGGKRFSFVAFVVSGNRKGKVGIAMGKSKEVSSAIAKATVRARKKLLNVALRDTTIPYEVKGKHGASKVIIRPASRGTGNVAGGAVRAVLYAAGVADVLTKLFGSSNGINAAKATLNGLAKLRSAQDIGKSRGIFSVKQLVKGTGA